MNAEDILGLGGHIRGRWHIKPNTILKRITFIIVHPADEMVSQK